MRKTRVAIVEDDERLRKAFERAISQADDCQLVGMFATGRDAIRELPPLAPDVILMDVNLPDTSGVECVATIAPQLPDSQILMVTVYQDPETTFRAITAGAHGYLVKPVMPKRLIESIREIRAGGVPMTRTIARKVIQAFRSLSDTAAPAATASGTPPAAKPAEAMLTPREQQVIELLVQGYSYKEAATQLGISVGTVGTYVNRIYEKLHLTSRREIVAWSRAGARDDG
jgi:DNA-binding NarL/FixJ family response regulator